MEGLTKILQTTLGGYSLSRILSALLTLLVCLVAARLLLKLAKRLLDRSKKLTARLRQIILTALKVVFYTLSGIITAEALGLNTSSLTALVSVLTFIMWPSVTEWPLRTQQLRIWYSTATQVWPAASSSVRVS